MYFNMVERIIVGPMNTNSYIFSAWKKECIIIDPGGDIDTLVSRMNIKNLKPRGIVCTHGHLDHTAAAGLLKSFYMEKGIDLKIAVHDADSRFFGESAKEEHRKSFSGLGFDIDDLLESIFSPIPEADIIIENGDPLFDSDLFSIHTPGHTPGSISLYSESQKLLFSGDTLFFEGIGRTDLPGGSGETLLESITSKLLILPDATMVFPGHGPITNIEREKKYNPYLV